MTDLPDPTYPKLDDLSNLSPLRARGRRKPGSWKADFLAQFLETLLVGEAARRVGVTRQGVLNARKTDEVFAAAYDEVEGHVNDQLEREAIRRAFEGVPRRKYDRHGELIEVEQVYSDSLLKLLLQSRMRDRYGEKARVELSGPEGSPMQFAVDAPPDVLDLARQLRDRLAQSEPVA